MVSASLGFSHVYSWLAGSLLGLVGLLLWRWRLSGRGCALRDLGKDGPAVVVAVLGSGGHTMEMLEMVRGLSPARYGPLHFVVAETDTSSVRTVQASEVRQPDAIHVIPRSREVGQSYASSVFSTLRATWSSWILVWRLAPDLVLCNGPGTCLPLMLGAWLQKLGWKPRTRILFVESFCRVETLSLTGRIVHAVGLADEFVVHWPELRDRYRGVTYLGQLF